MSHPEVCIAGAGIMGLSLALELHAKGANVAIFDQGEPLNEASTAAAGMLAAHDPENPAKLLALSKLSLALYPEYLNRLFDMSGSLVPLHTSATLQALGPHGFAESRGLPPVLAEETLTRLAPELRFAGQRFVLLTENSLDPRELAVALLTAVRFTSIDLRTHTPIRLIRSRSGEIEIHTDRETVVAHNFVDCTGAWAFTPTLQAHLKVRPRKGQMLAVAMPTSLPLHVVVRTPDIYIVPRTTDPARSRLIVGATVEDVGYDKRVYPADVARLRSMAAALLPPIADAAELETWAGLRPVTRDQLPLIGQVSKNQFIATGHYRNGILLAPATAQVMSQLLAGERPSVDLSPFSPLRQAR